MRRRKGKRRCFLSGLVVVMTVVAVSSVLLTACSSERGEATDRPGEGTAGDRGGHPDYKQLKRWMKADLKQIREAVRKGRQLDIELVDRFCSDARLMTTHEGKGDEYYGVFLKQVDSLAEAAKRGDQAALKEAVAALRKMEKQCHRRFK